MFTLVAYSDSPGASQPLTNVTPVADPHVRVEPPNIIVPAGMNNLLAVCALGAYITDARVDTPALRRTLLLDVSPINRDTEPLYPTAWHQQFYSPLVLDEYEPMRFMAAIESAGRQTGLIWLGDGPQSPVTGEIFTVRATGTTTLVAFTWTNVSLTFTQTLPAGMYQLVGMRALSTGCIAARCVFVGGTWRPGCLGCDMIGDYGEALFRRGALGVWGEFRHDQPPTIDFLSASPDTSETVWLDLIKIA